MQDTSAARIAVQDLHNSMSIQINWCHTQIISEQLTFKSCRLQFGHSLGIGCELEFNSSNLLRLTAQLFRHPVARRRGEKEKKIRARSTTEAGAANTKHLLGSGGREAQWKGWQSIDIDVCQTKNYAGLPAGEPVERQDHGGRDSPDVCPVHSGH